MKGRLKFLLIPLLPSLLLSCSPSSSSSSLGRSEVTEEVALDVAKKTLEAYKEVTSVSVSSSSLSLDLNAKYKQTKNVYLYVIALDNASFKIESKDISSPDIKVLLSLTGGYETKDIESFNDVVDEDASKVVSLDLDHEVLYYENNSLYAHLSKKMNKTIYNDESKNEELKIYHNNIKNLIDIDLDKIKEESNIIDPTKYFNPSVLLDEITSSTYKNYVKYEKIDSLYCASVLLDNNQIISLINNYSSSYSEKTSINEDALFNINVYYDENEISKVEINANVHAVLNFGSTLGKVEINYVGDGSLFYSTETPLIDGFNKEGYELVDVTQDEVTTFTTDIWTNLKDIYKEIVTLI